MRLEELQRMRLENLKKIKNLGVEPYPYSYNKTHRTVDVLSYCRDLNPSEKINKLVSTAGRIMSKRNFGKLFFLDLIDEKGKIQLVISFDSVGNEAFELIDYVDVGDFLGVKGNPYKTKRGESSIFVTEFEILSKSMMPLPDKWHGLKDVEVRYRKRYVDLIVNPKIKEVFVMRSKIISLVKIFLENKGFIEVETPLLQPTYGGANARPFMTKSHALKSDFYLSISPELYLKRLIIGGFEKIFTICKNFRNEDIDKTHNPEFTMMECYAAYQDYNDMMQLTEQLFEFVARELFGDTKITYQGKVIDLKSPWERITMHAAIKKYSGLDAGNLSDSELKELLNENRLEVEPFKRGLAIAELFEYYCEDKLIQPVFVIDHPKETTPLCKPHRSDSSLIERFEPFINGWEISNAYSELNDSKLQEEFFNEQANQGTAKGENHPIDLDFVEALKYGMPPTGGLGLGIDRMVMLFTDQPTIKDVLLFPQMKVK